MKKFLSLLLAFVMLFSLVACGDNPSDSGDGKTPVNSGDNQGDVNVPDDGGEGEGEASDSAVTEFEPEATYTYESWTSGLSANWNPHDYEDNNSSGQLGYLIDSFYTMAFNDELHPMEDATRTPFDGYLYIPSMASGMPVDVTAEVAAEHPDWIPEGATSGYAWEIPLREDLYFDTGYHITANSYVEGMKRILDYKLQNYRSTDVYANTYGIVGAEAYFKSGQYALSEFVSANMGADEYVDPANFTTTADGTYQYDGKDVVLDIKSGGNWGLDGGISTYAGQVDQVDRLIAAANEKGWVYLTPDLLKDLQDVIAMLHSAADVEEYAASAGDYAYQEFEEMVFFGFDNPEVTYEDTVGLYAKDDYHLVEVFKASCSGFTLFYNAIQDYLLLVEPDVYDSCITQQADGTYASTYMTSAETSPSYGPYSMTSYQTDKLIHYSRNDSWYGYHDDVNNVYKDPTDGKIYRTYQTTDIDIQALEGDAAVATAKNMFLSGELVTYGLQAADMDQYRNSEYCIDEPGASIFFMLLTGNVDGLQAREDAEGFDTAVEDIQTILCPSFRKAFAVSFDRQAYCDETSPSLTPGYGIFGKTIIYDPETAGYYRDTDVAKQALCDFYSVDTSAFSSLDDAVDSITGYDPEAAKELYTAAFQESLDAGYITDADGDGKCDQTINIIYAIGAQSVTDIMQLRINWMDTAIVKATEGTPFENKVHIKASAPLGGGEEFANALKSGSCDVCLCGWTGSAMDPYNLLQAYTWDSYSYAANWYHPQQDMLELTLNGETIEMSVYDWAECVTGNDVTVGDKTYNFGTNNADQETRLQILAGVEGKLLQTFTYIPFANDGSKFLLSQKVYYVVDEYNPVMGFGGLAYMKYNYNDEEWKAYCDEQIAAHGQLQY